MLLHIINYVFTNEVIQALFWTLIHSLWQGFLLALIAGAVLICTKNSGVALRYKLFSCILLSFIFISLATFCYEVYSVTGYNAISKTFIGSIINNAATNKQPQVNLIEKIILVLKSCESIIVLAWFAVITLKSINLLTGLRNVYVLKHRQVSDAGEYWNQQLEQLAVKAGVTKKVILLRSAIAKIPMVLGHLKPVILFPAAALTTLAPEEIEAILLHELAHIRRKDYLINILQSLAEIIFFFNPAVLWISSLIKEERENCCDDIAISQVKNKKQFIHALISFQEYNLTSKYAASFSGKRNHLLNRIKRIITNNNKTLNNMEKIFLATGIIITCLMAVAFTQHKQLSSATSFVQPAEILSVINKKDTVPLTVNDNESKYSMSTSMDGKQYRLVEVNGKVTELYVDGARIPDDKISDYNSVIDKLQKKLKEDKEKQAEAMQAQKEAMKAQSDLMKENMQAQKEELEKQAEQMNIDAKKLQEQLEDKIQSDTAARKAIQKAAIEAQAYAMKAKTLAMNDMLEMQSKMKGEMMKDQAEKLNQVMKEKDEIMKDQAVKLQEIMKEKDVMIKDQVDKQTKIIKDKTEQLIQQDLKKQIEQLKQQNENLKQQLNQKIDSIYKAIPTEPKGA